MPRVFALDNARGKMPSNLKELVEDTAGLQNRLVLVCGGESVQQRAKELEQCAAAFQSPVLLLGVEYARRLALIPRRLRPIQAGEVLRATLELGGPADRPACLDRIEVLFDASLRLDPLIALSRLAHARTVVAVWPGTLNSGRLCYAPPNHPEHRDYPSAGAVIYEIH